VENTLDEFFNFLVNREKEYGNFQPRAIFNELRNSSLQDKQDMILDFFNYLCSHGIIRMGLDFVNVEYPFMTFTKYGRTLIENEARRVALFEEFLKIFNSS